MSHTPSSNTFDRRQVLAILCGGALATRGAVAATDQPLQYSSLDHVALAVADPAKSAAFYSRIFGGSVRKDKQTTRRYVQLGPSFIAVAPPAQGRDGYRVDHICTGIPGFQTASVKSYLEHRGLAVRESAVGLFVADEDGIQVQLFSDNSWNDIARTSAPEAISSSEEPIFRPTGLDHLLLRTPDPEKSVAFYEKLFGPMTQRSNGRIWFQAGKSRIGVAALAGGQRAGVDHFCVSAPAFDYAAVTKKLEEAGAKVQTPEIAGWPEFRDPDGILVQVMSPRNDTKK